MIGNQEAEDEWRVGGMEESACACHILVFIIIIISLLGGLIKKKGI